MNIEKINWEAVMDELWSMIDNEEAFANGSSRYERVMHEANILRMEEEISCIEDGDYESVLEYYGEDFFKDFIEE